MRIKIISNPKKDWAKSLAKELKEYLEASGNHAIVKSGAEATICIGGDGTILYANHKGRIEGAVLGIGSDKSYICQIHRNEWREKILEALDSDPRELIMTLEADLNGKRFTAINDFVVHATSFRVVELDVGINDKKISFEGDGMILSSSVGSSSYAYSAGGERFGPLARKILAVPICPYKRMFSPSTLDADSSISVTVGHDCAFIADGVFVRKMRAGERLSVKKGKDMIFFPGVGRNA